MASGGSGDLISGLLNTLITLVIGLITHPVARQSWVGSNPWRLRAVCSFGDLGMRRQLSDGFEWNVVQF